MDSVYRQTSRDNYLIDLKYLTYGFTFLQEATDKILIKSATGREYPTGLFAQQEPYKCVQIDRCNEFFNFFTSNWKIWKVVE